MSDAIVLMAYGSPSRTEDIRPYLEDIREGRPVSDEAVEELTERYRRIAGRSPLLSASSPTTWRSSGTSTSTPGSRRPSSGSSSTGSSR